MSKRKTRKQKQHERSTKPSGQSRYALKIARRRKVAIALGLPPGTPWPVIWASTHD